MQVHALVFQRFVLASELLVFVSGAGFELLQALLCLAQVEGQTRVCVLQLNLLLPHHIAVEDGLLAAYLRSIALLHRVLVLLLEHLGQVALRLQLYVGDGALAGRLRALRSALHRATCLDWR